MRSQPRHTKSRKTAAKSMNSSAKPTIYSFTLFFSGADVLDDARLKALFDGGCDDALFGARDGAQYGAFDREADSFSEALASAMRDVTSAVTGVQVVRIEPDELVTLAAIAERSGLSREYVRLLSANKRGPGGFPVPVTYADHKTRLWHWPDVAHWLTEHQKAKVQVDTYAADLVAALNAAFDLREHASHLHDTHDLALVAQALRDASPLAVRDPRTSTAAMLAARRRPMSERLELALSWNAVAAELRAGLAAINGPTTPAP